jgi:hypothetical protein
MSQEERLLQQLIMMPMLVALLAFGSVALFRLV